MNELISIIVPVYKVEEYLDRCVMSLVNQTYCNLEIILVDDGSPDRCPQLCDDWVRKDSRIKVLHNKNSGVGYARNSGIKKASGDFLMFVDSDDYLPKDAVRILYDRMKRDNSDMAIGRHLKVLKNICRESQLYAWMVDSVMSGMAIMENTAAYEFPVAPWGKLYKRFVLEGIAYPALTCGEDLWVFPRIVERCKRISIVNSVVYYYFQRTKSIMHQKNEYQKEDELKATLHMAKCVWEYGFQENARRWFSRAIQQSVQIQNREIACEILCKGISADIRNQMIAGMKLSRQIELMSIFNPILFCIIQFVIKENRNIKLKYLLKGKSAE